MAMELIGAAGMTEELRNYYDMKLLMTAVPNFVFMNYGEKRPIPASQGKCINFRRFEKITLPTGSYILTEGTPPTVTNATVSKVEATISQYGQYSQLSDILDTQSIDPILTEYAGAFAVAMSEGLDIVVRDIVDAGTTIQYADAAARVGTSGVVDSVGSGMFLDAAEILEAVRTLKRNNAKPIEDNRYICILHPDNTKDLFEDSDITDSFIHAGNRGGDNPMFTGVLGDWQGVRFVETTNLKVHSSYGMSGADVYEVVMLGKEAYGISELSALSAKMIIHPRGTGGHTDPLEQYSTVGWKAALACTILNNDFLVVIMCNSSRVTAA